MFDSILTALFLAVPLIFSGSLHMWIVKKNIFPKLSYPISESRFGANKTWRGIIIMILATVPGVYLAYFLEPAFSSFLQVSLKNVNLPVLGISLGFAYTLLELPNSFIKRRLNIKPGERSDKHTFLFSFIDQADSAIGCAFIYWFILDPPLMVMVWIILLGPLIHMLVNLTLFSLGLRKQPL